MSDVFSLFVPEEATPQLRFFVPKGANVAVLQQLWVVRRGRSAQELEHVREWRDVPIVRETTTS